MYIDRAVAFSSVFAKHLWTSRIYCSHFNLLSEGFLRFPFINVKKAINHMHLDNQSYEEHLFSRHLCVLHDLWSDLAEI